VATEACHHSTMRLAVGGIHTESSTFNPVRTELQHFRVLTDDLLGDAQFTFLKHYPVTFMPTLHARAIPGGPVSQAAYQQLKADFLRRLEALLPLDGLYLAMHGAMFVEGLRDAEADWIGAARKTVGEDCLIAASYDLHGNISQTIIDQLDMMSAYRTAPHIDVVETQKRACDMLLQALKTGERPGLAWVNIPVLVPGERSSTEDEPARSLYAGLPELNARAGIWDASLLVGYVWADEPRATASSVMTGTDTAAMSETAALLAERYWQARHDFRFGVVTDTVDGCIARAQSHRGGLAIIADSGDNPTGGGVGDRADVLRALLAHKCQKALVAGIADPPATNQCYAAGVGATLALSIGGALDSESQPIRVTAQVIYLAPASNEAARQAVINTEGVTIVLTGGRRPFHNLSDFAALELSLHDVKVLVVKSGYLSPELKTVVDLSLMALSPGVVSQDIEHLTYHNWQHPIYPVTKDFDWQPAVRFSRRMS
jgi:microcystin degradation protein MlrC